MKNVLVIAVAAAALIGFLVFWDAAPNLFLRGMGARPLPLPTADSYMTDAVTWRFGATGALTYTLDTIRAESFDKDGIAILNQPRVLASATKPGEKPWHLKAATGVLHNADNRIVLRTDVHAWQEADTGTTEIKSQELTYLADTRHVQSAVLVHLISPDGHTTGVGLSADLDPKVYSLQSRVHSVLQPK